MQRKTKFSLAGAAIALIATVAVAAGFDQINSGYLKIGNGAASTKTLEFNVGNTTNDPIITGDSTNNLNVSAAATRFLERPANGVNYVELNVPAALSGNVAFTLPTAAAGSNGAVLTATTAGVMSFVSPLPLANGGTNATSKSGAFDSLSPMTTAGDTIYGGTAGTGTRLAAGSATTVLHSGTTPSWAAITLTTDVTGSLPIGNGGTGAATKAAGFDALSPMTTSGDIIVGGASGTGTRSACATANTVLRGGTPAACGALVNADIPTTLTGKTLSGNTATNLVSGSGTLTLNTTGTITVPNDTQTLATQAGIETLTNKTLSSTNTITNATSAGFTVPGGFTNTLPAATTTLVGKGTVDILTNKTLSGNTATNLISGSGTLTLNTSGTITLPNATATVAIRNADNNFSAAQSITGTGGNVLHGLSSTSATSSGTTVSVGCLSGLALGGGCVCSSANGLRNSYLVNATTWGCDWNASCASNTAYVICAIQ